MEEKFSLSSEGITYMYTRTQSLFDSPKAMLGVVIPAYQAERTIERVLEGIPLWIDMIIVVDDGSTDRTAAIVNAQSNLDQRITLVQHKSNQGVSAAMVTGFQEAIRYDAQIVVKMDSDGQMSPSDLPQLIEPILTGKADCAKGNRFRDFQALRHMPSARRMGNLALSFLCKAAVGYWDLFDPTNGYIAIRTDVIKLLSLDRIRGYYFFEIALLSELYLAGAVVKDVAIGARYGDERSSLLLWRVVIEYPPRLFGILLRRLALRYWLYDFTIVSVYILMGLPLLSFGVLFGSLNWWHYSRMSTGAPTGTVVISALTILLGVQFLLAAIQGDLMSIPRRRIGGSPFLTRTATRAKHAKAKPASAAPINELRS